MSVLCKTCSEYVNKLPFPVSELPHTSAGHSNCRAAVSVEFIIRAETIGRRFSVFQLCNDCEISMCHKWLDVSGLYFVLVKGRFMWYDVKIINRCLVGLVETTPDSSFTLPPSSVVRVNCWPVTNQPALSSHHNRQPQRGYFWALAMIPTGGGLPPRAM